MYSVVESTYNWWKHELRARPGVSLRRRLAMWPLGFYAESYVLYDFSRNDPVEYLSDFQQFRCEPINAWNWLYKHKLSLRSFLLAMGFRQAGTAAYVYDGQILADPFGGQPRYLSPSELYAYLSVEGAKYIVKPEDGLRGQDLFLVECRGGVLMRRRGHAVEPFDLEDYLASINGRGGPRATLIEHQLQQAEFWQTLFPDTGNTIRLLTLWPPRESGPFIAAAVQRVGTTETVPADHWTSGGICAPIDIATGELGVGRMYPLRERRPRQPLQLGRAVEVHPDTGARIAGSTLPYWGDITATVLRAAACLPFNRLAGWDLLVDDTGTPVIIEANGNSGISLLQVHGGLLRDPRVRRFYEAYGVL